MSKDTKIELTAEELSKVIVYFYSLIRHTMEDESDGELLKVMQEGLLKDFMRTDDLTNKIKRTISMHDLEILLKN